MLHPVKSFCVVDKIWKNGLLLIKEHLQKHIYTKEIFKPIFQTDLYLFYILILCVYNVVTLYVLSYLKHFCIESSSIMLPTSKNLLLRIFFKLFTTSYQAVCIQFLIKFETLKASKSFKKNSW